MKIMKCISNSSWENCLTIGKIYEVKTEQWNNDAMYYLNDDNDEPMNTHLSLFEDVDYIFKQYKTIEEMLKLIKRTVTSSRGIENKNIVAEMEVGNLAIDLNIIFDEEGNKHINYWVAFKDEFGNWANGDYLIESPILNDNLEKHMFETLMRYAKENKCIY